MHKYVKPEMLHKLFKMYLVLVGIKTKILMVLETSPWIKFVSL